MNTQEFAEWLRSEIARDRASKPKTDRERIWVSGHRAGMEDCLDKLAHLATLDSSHDLPSAKG